MAKTKALDQVDTRAEDSAFRAAARYAATFPEADVAAIQIVVGMGHATKETRLASERLMAKYSPYLSGGRYTFVKALYLAEGHRLALSELARETDSTSPNVTHLAAALEKTGLVRLTASNLDKRVTFAELTDDGVEICSAVVPEMMSFHNEVCSHLTAAEKAQFLGLLAKLRSGPLQTLVKGRSTRATASAK